MSQFRKKIVVSLYKKIVNNSFRLAMPVSAQKTYTNSRKGFVRLLTRIKWGIGMGILSLWVESLTYEYEILKSCTHHKSPRSKCKKCQESCKKNAISFINGIPSINSEQCTQCGDCISACTVGAVAGIFPARTVKNHQLVITGDQAPATKELLVYYKKGIKEIVYDGELSEEWRQSIEDTNQTLHLLGEPSFTLMNGKMDATTIEMTRRELFFSWKKEAKTMMVNMAPAKWRFNQEDLQLAKYYPNHQFAEVTLDASKCTLCKACEILCPHECLKITENSFVINTQSCSVCHLCEDICPEKVLTVTEKVSELKVLNLPVVTKVCSTCGQNFKTLTESDEICVPCEKRKELLAIY